MSAPATRGARAQADLTTILRARNPLVWIASGEELRVERAVVEVGARIAIDAVSWDCAAGVTSTLTGAQVVPLNDPSQAIVWLLDEATRPNERLLLVMRDLAPWLNDPSLRRQLRNAHRLMTSRPRGNARAIVVLDASGAIPADLRGSFAALEWPIPDRAEIAAALTDRVSTIEAASVPTGEAFERAVDAAVGLTMSEADNCFAASLVETRTIDAARVSREKRRVVSQTPGLTWYDPDPRGLDAVGGLVRLKAWLVERSAGFTARARAYGLPDPRGALLVGVPGCGKSLTAKAVAAAWQLPLLRLDLGALRGKYVGDSEGNLRRALAMAETVAPAVLWLDEVEKALGGATGPAGDGGVASDALGAILGWMQERTAPVFTIATSNDVSGLPPEFLRKGRFDEVWFVDLPTTRERAEILTTALDRVPGGHARALLAKPKEIVTIAAATAGWSGAEIAALVPEALYRAFADGERDLTVADLGAVLELTVPLSKTAPEKIESLRTWSIGRARDASTRESPATAQRIARDLDIDP